ncbi:pupal cuticle protein PCP52-like [Maniola hyperantus]|uniref:pupal cuticle protein PCP52-like n=1 Tax=Aphantopus hyperantus TaxID=2795564 RepID=UPI00156A2E1A|nr:pupal cuticle protein PCP52-like [Maniola hyperantus]
MRFLIVTVAVFACAAAAPSALLPAAYSAGLINPWASPLAAPWAVSPLAVARTVALPAVGATIPPGDIQGAAIEANNNAVDAVRAVNDQVSELQGRAINAAEDHAWQSVSAVQTAQAQVDGAAASVAPNVAKSLVSPVAPIAAYSAAPIATYSAAPVATYAAAPALYSSAYSPLGLAGPLAYARAW